MNVRVSAGLVLAVLAAAACSATDQGTSEETQPSVTTVVGSAPSVAPSESKAVIEDWYVDGVFNSPHRCAAVRAAFERLPTSPGVLSTVYEDMRSLESRTCG